MRIALIMMILLALPIASGVRIEMVYYDTSYDPHNEAVLLKNTGPEPVNLTGWRLSTTRSVQDATLQGIIPAQGTYLIATTGWSESRENMSWPEADHEQSISLPKARGFAQLVTNEGTVMSTVGWGSKEELDIVGWGHPTYEGSPHPGVQRLEALVRINNTKDNSVDFIAAPPRFDFKSGQPAEDNSVVIEVVVTNEPPQILAISVEDDEPETTAVRLLPIPGTERLVQVNITVQDPNGVQELQVTVNGVELSTNDTGLNGTFKGQVPITIQTSELLVSVSDAEHSIQETITIELLDVVGVSLPPGLSITLRPGDARQVPLTLENTGTAPVQLHLKGNAPTLAGKLLGHVRYVLGGDEFPLEESFRAHDTVLAPGQQASVNLWVEAGYVPSGTYTGQVVIAAVKT
jgi:hypothetical protein